ncbi:MAG: NADH-quinone oxidoreductase subunit NuoH [Candidatus Nitrosocaldus sp.]|nr:NADH-quinone oxidoreductase subunit NuoH [Candidatus Nitrosocaldus sp.]MDW7999958.1 NADH-quinone oxidoreductase subunit NuoH [Candidatus Nitrosocaldus sp.]
MATVSEFTFSNFIKSVLWLLFWVLMIVSLIALPILFIVLFYVPPPVINGVEINPYLLLTMLTNPQVGAPLIRPTLDSLFFRIVVFPGFTFAALFATVLIFAERKFLAKMQLRVGPYHAGREAFWWANSLGGFLQLIADLLKLLGKEIIVPSGADKPIFWAAPVVLVIAAAGLIALIPVAPGWVIADIDVSLLAVFALLGFFPLTVLLASYASNSKYPFIGGLRALYQLISYEIPLILAVLPIVILASTLSLTGIVEAQYAYWFILLVPIGAFVFFITALAELERIPFDLPEAESEIVAGWLTEYSGMAYGLIQLANYIKMYALSALFTTLFLGGWIGPEFLPGVEVFDVEVLSSSETSGIFWFTIKTFGVALFMILVRGTNPRVKIDVLLRAGWSKLIALSFINVFIAVALLYLGVVGVGP